MCGIAGIVSKRPVTERAQMLAMLSCLAHRGPEEEGVWQNAEMNVLLGQRRLAIIDLSPRGKQPMVTSDGKIAITYNGEIYNYLEIKKDLEKLGHVFNTKSDTEVLLVSYLEWGVNCLTHLNGMFAFAIWDSNKQTLFAARDHVGEKPFKYYHDNEKFVFASEIKALLQDSAIKREVDWQSIDLALSFRYIPAPKTGYKNIYKLPAGHYLLWQNGELKIQQYWDAGQLNLLQKNAASWKKDIWELFLDSVQRRMISDVPLGAFLSGGIDSTSVVAAMKEVTAQPITTFVISYDKNSEDCKYAAIAAKYLGTNHHEIELGNISYAKTINKLMYHYDEPFFDQSALPSLLINEQIKKHVTVALSGDGADELFGGYSSYRFAWFLEQYQKLPAVLYKNVAPLLMRLSQNKLYRAEVMAKSFFEAYTEYYALWKSYLPRSQKYLTKFDLYTSEFKKEVSLKNASEQMNAWFTNKYHDVQNQAMLADIRSRLPDGYLAKVDFASMASAVEVRAPFLDRRLVALSQQMPSALKINFKETKHIWKEIIKDKIPMEVIRRKKMGFTLPLDQIIQHELRPLVEDVLLSQNSKVSNIFSVSTIRRLWSDHCGSKADYSNHIWSLLILELWLQKLEK